MESALVTGATSYLGRELTRRLMAEGVSVHVVTRVSTDLGWFDDLPSLPHICVHDGSTESLADVVSQAAPDMVFHLATLYCREHSPKNIEPLIQSNILFGTQLLEALRQVNNFCFINAGTYFQYLDNTGYRPVNLYAATKKAFEDIIFYYSDALGFKTVTLNLFDVYGPSDWRAKLLAAIRRAQLSGNPLPLPTEDFCLDLVFIDDVVSAFLRAAELIETPRNDLVGKTFAVSSGVRHTISEVISLFEEVGGTPIRQDWGKFPTPSRQVIVPWEGPVLQGWRAEVSLRDGIRRFIAKC